MSDTFLCNSAIAEDSNNKGAKKPEINEPLTLDSVIYSKYGGKSALNGEQIQLINEQFLQMFIRNKFVRFLFGNRQFTKTEIVEILCKHCNCTNKDGLRLADELLGAKLYFPYHCSFWQCFLNKDSNSQEQFKYCLVIYES